MVRPFVRVVVLRRSPRAFTAKYSPGAKSRGWTASVPRFGQNHGMSPPALRTVLLGASNLTFALRTWVARLRAAAGGPVEVLAACGNGRSYGIESRFLFVRHLPGVTGCGLWDALAARPPLPAVALVADIGNDILYEQPPERIVSWVETCLERLAAHHAHPVLAVSSLPVIERVGRFRYLAVRTLFYTGRKLPYELAMERSHELDRRLRELAAKRAVPLVEPELSWYKVDPIHLRRTAWPAACDAMVGAWGLPCRDAPPLGRPARRRGLPGLPFAEERLCGRALRAPQPALAWEDGTTISFY